MHGKYYSKTISPDLDASLFNAACGGTDILFDWQEILIPTGSCNLKSLSAIVQGINAGTGNDADFRLYFAKSIDGVAPATFGTTHAANTVAITSTFRRNILGFLFVDASTVDDVDTLKCYNVVGSRFGVTNNRPDDFILQGEPHGTRAGFSSVYVAGIAAGAAFDFGTDCDLNDASHVAASTAPVQITTSGTDPRNCFQPGDILAGETGTVTMEVVSVDSATTMTVKDVSAQIDHQEQLILQNPMVFHFGFEY